MTHNQNTQPIQCHYAVSKEYINSVSRDTHVESPHFPIYLNIKDNYFKLQLEINPYLPVSHYEFQTKAQTLHNIHQNKIHSLSKIYPIIQQTDVTLNTNKTEPLKQFSHDANYAELINTVKFLLPAMDDFIPKSPTLYNYFHKENTKLNDTFRREMQQQDPVFRQFLIWKRHKNFPPPFTNYTS